jgi:hypothetical protein
MRGHDVLAEDCGGNQSIVGQFLYLGLSMNIISVVMNERFILSHLFSMSNLARAASVTISLENLSHMNII